MIHVRDSRLRYLKRAARSHVKVGSANPVQALFSADFFEVEAEVDLDGAPTDSGAGYRLGFTQLQWIETNRATYCGLVGTDGRLEVKRDRPPARPFQACRDVMSSNDPFTYPAGSRALMSYMPHHFLNLDLGSTKKLPGTVKVSHADAPGDLFLVQRINSMTGKQNYLEWAQLEFHFCTVLLLRKPSGELLQLQHFYWNVHWNVNFTPIPSTGLAAATIKAIPSEGKNVMNFGPFIDGDVTDRRFASLIAAPVVPTCNTVANQEAAKQIVTESRNG